MPIDWQELLTNVGTTLASGVVVVGAAAWVIRALVSHGLTRDADKFKIQLKADVDEEIERLKAFLTRASRVHERQLEILQKLYGHLFDVKGLLVRMISPGRFECEIKPDEYAQKVTQIMESARDEFVQGRLFLSPAIVQQCDSFFDLVFKVQHDFALAHHPMIGPGEHAKLWGSAAETVHKELAKVLSQIEESARSDIHG
jgi:hypothetical protein